jgi:hypothetical protein
MAQADEVGILGETVHYDQDNIFPIGSWQTLYKVHADVCPGYGVCSDLFFWQVAHKLDNISLQAHPMEKEFNSFVSCLLTRMSSQGSTMEVGDDAYPQFPAISNYYFSFVP